jgi:tetratricopeptide (TPR) repeat protein
MLIQVILDAASCIILFYIASHLFNNRIGIISAFIYACYGIAIFYTGILLAPSLVIFLTLAFVASLLMAKTKKRFSIFVFSGILLGLVVAARPNLTLLLFFLPVWFFVSLKKTWNLSKALRGFLLLLFGFLIVFASISLRNYLIVKEFTPSVVGGFNFYIGNNADATGYFMSPHGISSSPIDQVKTSIEYAENETGRRLSYPQASRFWFRKGLEYLKDNPAEALQLILKKFALFLRKEEISHQNIDYNLSKDFASIFRLPFISFGLIAPFAMLGLFLAILKREAILLPAIIIFSCLASVLIFFMSVRYRLPALPFLIMCSAYTIHRFAENIKTGEVKSIFLWSVILIILYLGINLDFEYFDYNRRVPKLHHNNLGKFYSKEGDLDKSIVEFKKALAIDPNMKEVHHGMGYVYYKKGEFDTAISEYEQELRINPNSEMSQNNIGLIFYEQGRLDAAIGRYKNALMVDPDYAIAQSNLGNAFFDKGDFENAVVEFKKAGLLQPDDATVFNRLGLSYARMRRFDEAIPEYERAIAIDPLFAKAHSNLGSALLSKGDIDRAITHISEALRIEPGISEARYNMGIALASQGRTDEAILHYQETVKIYPDFAEAHYNLGTLLIDAGKTDEALGHLREALRVKPDYQKAKNKLELLLDSQDGSNAFSDSTKIN